jgi:hypothetical protein
MVDVKVRSPTGRAWLLFIVGFIVAGELLFEVQKARQATFFNMPFTDAELIPWIVLLGLAAAFGLVWLVRLYVFPGRISFDAENGVIRRRQQLMLKTRLVEAPAAEWTVRISYFSEEHRDRGVFKRAELAGPDFHEVLLFTDCRPAEALARGIESMAEQLAELRVDIESAAEAH